MNFHLVYPDPISAECWYEPDEATPPDWNPRDYEMSEAEISSAEARERAQGERRERALAQLDAENHALMEAIRAINARAIFTLAEKIACREFQARLNALMERDHE